MVSRSQPPVSSLPSELLTEILVLASPDQRTRPLHDEVIHAPFFPYTGIFVCKRWYRTLRATPEAWLSVFVLFDEAYQPKRTRKRIHHHQQLCRTLGPKMHLDVHYQGRRLASHCHCREHEYQVIPYCDTCSIRQTMGRAELWRSLRVIISPEECLWIDFIHHTLLGRKRGPSARFPRLTRLQQLDIVPHLDANSAVINAGEATLPNNLDLEDVLLVNLFGLVSLGDTQVKPKIRTLTLVNVSVDVLADLDLSKLTCLEELTITNDEDSNWFGEGWTVEGALPTVHTARLQLEHLVTARKLLSRLTGVKYLDLYSRDTTMWPALLEDWPHFESRDVGVTLHTRLTFQRCLQSKFGSLISVRDSTLQQAAAVELETGLRTILRRLTNLSASGDIIGIWFLCGICFVWATLVTEYEMGIIVRRLIAKSEMQAAQCPLMISTGTPLLRVGDDVEM